MCWGVGVIAIVSYGQSLSWTGTRTRSGGAILVYELLDHEPADHRAERLRELGRNLSEPLSLLTLDQVEHRVGRKVDFGERIPHRVSMLEEWYFLVFTDGQGALSAGPVNPTLPTGFLPLGIILALIGLPAISGLLAFRIERELAKVERASRALATGELSARVDNQDGPSHELASSFNAMAERVERLIRSREELVQAISHELGSPLSRLRFHVELLENQTGPQSRERLNAMGRELDALDELVSELLGYVQSDELELRRHTFDPRQDILDLTELARLEAPEDRVNVQFAASAGTTVTADERLFQRAVENVVRNAVQHARSTVLIELTPDEEFVRVEVHDDGPGIPEELREKVMIPFFRVDLDRSRKTGGVGLGLAIVSRIMQRHGGRVSIASSALGGALVTTSWPRSVPGTHGVAEP